MKKSEIRSYFQNNKATCQSCGREILWKDRAIKQGQDVSNQNMNYWWKAYSRNAWQADADYKVLCKECYDKAVECYGTEISRDEMLEYIELKCKMERAGVV